MPLAVFYSDLAQLEFDEMVNRFSGFKPVLGEAFIKLASRSLQLAAEFPEMHAEVPPGLRRIVIRRFRVNLYYRFDSVAITVAAVLHGSREQHLALRGR